MAVIGAGWAGLAAAVRACESGHGVTLVELAQRPGGRARSIDGDVAGDAVDNGQHILIGAYARTLALMRTVGAPADDGLARLPLALRYPDGRGLQVPAGAGPTLGFLRAVAACQGWTPRERLAFLAAAARWRLAGFRCAPGLTVAALCAGLPPAVRQLVIDPLCVAALNTPAAQASAQVLLRVLKDALFGGRGAADLLLPRRPLGELLPEPACRWLAQHGAQVRLGTQARQLERAGAGWSVDGAAFDAVILATPAATAARLAAPVAPAWSVRAAALRYEPIVTVWLECPGGRLPAPMTALFEGPEAPAQFAFDHGAFGAQPGRFTFVVSGAAPWVERGRDATAQAVLAQARDLLPQARVARVVAEKRATFRCGPALDRPPAAIAPGLWAAGDYVQGPYPATLEGAVRAGEAAAAALGG